MSVRRTGNDPYGFGVLNKITKSEIHKKLDPGRTKFLKASSDLVKSSFEEDILNDTGPYIGIVLRVEPDSASGESSLAYWVGRIFGKDDAPNLIQIKARIPELHTMYPFPASYDQGDRSLKEQVGDYQKIIDMYPTFTAMAENDDQIRPNPGDLVWLDFGDKTNYHNGIYIKPVRGGRPTEAVSDAQAAGEKLADKSWEKDGRQYGPPGTTAPNAEESYRASDTTISYMDPRPYKENRVWLYVYGSLPRNSDLLTKTLSGKKVHVLLATRLDALNEAWMAENPGKPAFKVGSGHRTRRFNNKDQYRKWCIDDPGKYNTMKECRKYKAYKSPHETGLAVDFMNNGLYSKVTQSKNYAGGDKTRRDAKRDSLIAAQRKTDAHKWLVANAHKYGFSPYKAEPWHWEVLVPRENWANGEEFRFALANTHDLATYVIESSDKSGKRTNDNHFKKHPFV